MTRLDQTNTIAVQGAAASRISPAIYDGIWSPGRNGANTWAMKKVPRRAIEKGFTAQLMNRVTPTPLACSVTLPSAPKSIFSNIGMIMSQMRTATGKLTFATSAPATAEKSPGNA